MIFIDSSNVREIERFYRMGVIRGVTTNPTIMFKDGVIGGLEGVKQRSIEIANLVSPYPVSIEVMTNDPDGMKEQAIEFSKWADNIVIKVTIHGPNGELDNITLIHELEKACNVRVNVTAIMSAQQCLLASLAGATYVSIFGGRVNDMGSNVCSEITKTRKVFDSLKLNTKLIIGSVREVLNIVEWYEVGADIVTVPPNLLERMLIHPYSKETVQMFLNDAGKIND